jgi:hypothetical protein
MPSLNFQRPLTPPERIETMSHYRINRLITFVIISLTIFTSVYSMNSEPIVFPPLASKRASHTPLVMAPTDEAMPTIENPFYAIASRSPEPSDEELATLLASTIPYPNSRYLLEVDPRGTPIHVALQKRRYRTAHAMLCLLTQEEQIELLTLTDGKGQDVLTVAIQARNSLKDLGYAIPVALENFLSILKPPPAETQLEKAHTRRPVSRRMPPVGSVAVTDPASTQKIAPPHVRVSLALVTEVDPVETKLPVAPPPSPGLPSTSSDDEVKFDREDKELARILASIHIDYDELTRLQTLTRQASTGDPVAITSLAALPGKLRSITCRDRSGTTISEPAYYGAIITALRHNAHMELGLLVRLLRDGNIVIPEHYNWTLAHCAIHTLLCSSCIPAEDAIAMLEILRVSRKCDFTSNSRTGTPLELAAQHPAGTHLVNFLLPLYTANDPATDATRTDAFKSAIEKGSVESTRLFMQNPSCRVDTIIFISNGRNYYHNVSAALHNDDGSYNLDLLQKLFSLKGPPEATLTQIIAQLSDWPFIKFLLNQRILIIENLLAEGRNNIFLVAYRNYQTITKTLDVTSAEYQGNLLKREKYASFMRKCLSLAKIELWTKHVSASKRDAIKLRWATIEATSQMNKPQSDTASEESSSAFFTR